MAGHAASYYAATAPAFPVQPPLEGEARADVGVVGGGLAGLAAARHLAERGYSVALLEAERIGWGASGRNGGQILADYGCGIARLEALLGSDAARTLWDFSVEALDDVRADVARLQIDCGWRDGHLSAALGPRQAAELRAWHAKLERVYGYARTRYVEGAALAEVVASPRYRAGLLDAGAGHLHPLAYTLGMARATQAAGVRLHEGSRVIRIETGAKPAAHTARGVLRCEHLVLAGNAYLGRLVPALDAKIMPVGTYIVATEPLGEARAAALLPRDAAIADTNFVLDYFRRSTDHRLLFGGRVSYSGLEPPDLVAGLRRRMKRVFPQLGDVAIDYAWGGFVDITMNRAPHFGRLAGGNVYFAQGFSGHGMALAGLAGKVIAEAVAGSAERLDLFARIPHRDFPGGRWLRTPTLVLAMLWHRLRDLL